MHRVRSLLIPVALLVAAAACSDDAGSADGDGERPTVVVTTSVLGDVVDNLTDGAVDVNVLIPAGADPHQFQLSARQVAEVAEADVLVVNGGDLEVGLVDVIASAESDGVTVISALEGVDPLPVEGSDHDDHDDHDGHDHDADDHDDGHGHDHGGVDPHFFTDPGRMADAVEHIARALDAAVDGLDVDIVASANAYAETLRGLAEDVAELLAPIDEDDRVLVTNHDVLAYFADAYDFEVIGTVIPTASTSDAASAASLSDLAALVRAEGVPAVFVDVSASAGLAETLADEVDGVEIVELYTESLGESGSEGDSYVGMVRANAERIAAALG